MACATQLEICRDLVGAHIMATLCRSGDVIYRVKLQKTFKMYCNKYKMVHLRVDVYKAPFRLSVMAKEMFSLPRGQVLAPERRVPCTGQTSDGQDRPLPTTSSSRLGWRTMV